MEKITLPPLPVLDDFALFLTFLQSREQLPLSKAQAQLNRTDLFRLNGELHFKAGWVVEKSPQASYPELDYFYHVVVAAKLAYIHYGPKGTYLQFNPEKLEQYWSLTDTEKYFFLLESGWCYVSWNKLCDQRGDYYLSDIFKLLGLAAESAPGQEFDVVDRRIPIPGTTEKVYVGNSNKAVQMFWFLGFFDLEPDLSLTKKPDRYTLSYRKVRAQELSRLLVPVLLRQRPFKDWNLPFRKEIGMWNVPLGVPADLFFEEEEETVTQLLKQEELPAFLDAFKPLFEPDELVESLYPKESPFIGGRYTLKVSLAAKVYRTFAFSASATLVDVHLAIQHAFDFDNDHLYAFFMDGERWSYDSFSDPRGEEGPLADEVKLGELDLHPGRRFLYLFDFGASWEFQVDVLHIEPTVPEPEAPVLVEEKGKAPEQYGEGDDW